MDEWILVVPDLFSIQLGGASVNKMLTWVVHQCFIITSVAEHNQTTQLFN